MNVWIDGAGGWLDKFVYIDATGHGRVAAVVMLESHLSSVELIAMLCDRWCGLCSPRWRALPFFRMIMIYDHRCATFPRSQHLGFCLGILNPTPTFHSICTACTVQDCAISTYQMQCRATTYPYVMYAAPTFVFTLWYGVGWGCMPSIWLRKIWINSRRARDFIHAGLNINTYIVLYIEKYLMRHTIRHNIHDRTGQDWSWQGE